MQKSIITYSDKELLLMLKGTKADSEKGFKILYDRYAQRVNAYCIRILFDREAAADIFQETFYKFYQNVKADIETGTVIGYLITIARNLCLNYKRDKKITVSIDELELPDTDANEEMKDEYIELVKMAIDLLEMEYKEPLILRVYDNMDYHEIASICGLTEVTARSRVFRAKQKIKEILSPYFKEYEKEN